MGVRDDFNQWPLGRQLQVIFITSGFLLVLILVVITVFQLQWLKEQIISQSTNVLMDNLLNQMRILGSIEAKFLKNEFFNHIESANGLKGIDSLVLGFVNGFQSKPFQLGTSVQNTVYTSTQTDYTTGAYMTSVTLTPAGSNLENSDTPIDKIYPIIYDSIYLSMYQGYETDQIIHYYPGSLTTDDNYTPLVRE